MLLFCSAATAQDRTDPAGMGRGRASIATARGLGAVGNNPGALDLAPIDSLTLDQRLVFSIYTFGGTFGATYLSSDEFRDIFASGTKDRSRLADLLQDERLFANGAIDLIAARYRTDFGTWGLHFGQRIYARINLPNDFADVIRTLNFGSQNFLFTNRGIGGDWLTELGISYGKSFGSTSGPGWFPTVGLGLTGKLLLGVAHFDAEDNSVISVRSQTLNSVSATVIQGGYIFKSATADAFKAEDAVGQLLSGLIPGIAGTGLGADLGLSGVLYRKPGAAQGDRPVDALYYGMALQNLGFVSWSGNTYERRAVDINDTIPGADLNAHGGLDTLQGKLTKSDGFTTHLPATFRAGVGVNVSAYVPTIPGTLTVDVEGELPISDLPGNPSDYRLAAGFEWAPLRWLAVRSGIGRVGTGLANVGVGLGVRPIDWLTLDVATSDIKGYFDGVRVDLAARVAAGFNF
jgi:hypothetical protein